MLLLDIEHRSREPIYRQISRQIIRLIENDALRGGNVLPPTRELATRLSVSRFTVAHAYDELWARGYVESRQGSFTRIRPRPKIVSRSREPAPSELPELRASRAARILSEHQRRTPTLSGARDGWIDFSQLTLDPRLFPVDDLRGAFGRVLRPQHSDLLNYWDPTGYGPLREFVARRMQRHGVDIAPDEVLITHGSQQALNLLARLLLDPGQVVALEQPTYSSAVPMLRSYGARILGIQMRDDGMDLDTLEAGLRRRTGHRRPALVYTIPTFHNPTGITTTQPHRERLLELCEHYGVPLVEDGFQEEITFFGKTILPIKSMDRRGIVFYVGTFSKVFIPGLRIGWIAGRRDAIRQLAPLKYVDDISSSPFVQAALHRFCASGAYELHLRRMNRVFAGRMRHAIAVLRERLPKALVRLVAPSGGYLLWLRLDGATASEAELLQAMQEQKVSAAPASHFYWGRVPGLALRLSISSLNGEEIEEGACRLAQAIRAL